MKKFQNVRNILSHVPKKAYAILGTVIAITAVLIPVAINAWGPARDVYCIKDSPIACPVSNPAGTVADHVTFNSIANNPAHGDERNFMQIKDANSGNGTYADSITIQPGHTYDVYMYYHNNASSTLNDAAHNYKGIANGVNVMAQIPALIGNTETTANGFVRWNGSPSEYGVWDSITLKSANNGQIALRLVPGSAKLYNHNDGKGNATKITTLSDNIVKSEGAKIGYNLDANGNVKLDGVIPGCHEYAGYVVFKLYADQADFTVNKLARVHNSNPAEFNKGWIDNVIAQPGDTIDYLIQYTNTGTTQQNNVVIQDILPAGMEFVSGSARYYNHFNPAPAGAPATDLDSNGWNLGNYAPGADAVITFSAKLPLVNDLTCGVNAFRNIGKVLTNNGHKEDPADVTVNKECIEEKCPIPGKEHLNKDDPNCKEDEVVEPEYICKLLTADRITIKRGEKVNFTVTPQMKGDVSVKEYKMDFGDTSTFTGTSNKFAHIYANEGTYTAKAFITFMVEGKTVAGVTSAECTKTIKVSKDETKKEYCPIKGKEHLLKDDPACSDTPSELPKTGGELGAAAGFGSVATAAAYYVASRRQLNR